MDQTSAALLKWNGGMMENWNDGLKKVDCDI
jgi:hypothetical protein